MEILPSIFQVSLNSFQGQEEGERILITLRRHPFVIIMRVTIALVMFLTPFFMAGLFSPFIESRGLIPLFIFLGCVWMAIIWQLTFYTITMYLLDVWIVTDRRIIDSTHKGFFNRTVSELRIARVQNISVKTVGPLETFLHFGNLEIQTAGGADLFNFSQIPHPEKVKDEIMAIVSASHQI